jgi:hypothetical protein
LQVFREEGLLVQMQCVLVVHLKQTVVFEWTPFLVLGFEISILDLDLGLELGLELGLDLGLDLGLALTLLMG